jgi:hypothetical protein
LASETKLQVLREIIANRDEADSAEFTKAFNQIILLWGHNDDIKKLIFVYRTKPETSTLIEIISLLCKLENISHLSREDILNVFIRNKKS